MTKTFKDIGLAPDTLKAVTEKGYLHPTPIQEHAIPYILMGEDLLASAQTGTGKTASFTLPMIDILHRGRAKARMPRSLIIEPTRELAAQVAENFDEYGKYHPLSQALLVGGTSMNEQIGKLEAGVDVLIVTPGRLIDLFERGNILLTDIKILVLDECDRMLDMGFIPDIERICRMLPRKRQTLMFSATFPTEVKRIAKQFLTNPREIRVAPSVSTAETVTQAFIKCGARDKKKTLLDLIKKEKVGNALIFCNRKIDVDTLHKALKAEGKNVRALHGDMSQPERTKTLAAFKAGDIDLMVCSDVAARGIDISGLSHVFNYDVPHHAEDYIHRIGRTGRAGQSGRAFTLATKSDAESVEAIEKLIGHTMPSISVDDAVALKNKEIKTPAQREEIKVEIGGILDDTDAPEGRRKRRSKAVKKSESKKAADEPYIGMIGSGTKTAPPPRPATRSAPKAAAQDNSVGLIGPIGTVPPTPPRRKEAQPPAKKAAEKPQNKAPRAPEDKPKHKKTRQPAPAKQSRRKDTPGRYKDEDDPLAQGNKTSFGHEEAVPSFLKPATRPDGKKKRKSSKN